MSGATLRQYANASRMIGRVLMFIRCRCHGLLSWEDLAVVTLREARVGPFVGCGMISGRSQEAPIRIVSAHHLQCQSLSLPHPEFVHGGGKLSVLTYHRRAH